MNHSGENIPTDVSSLLSSTALHLQRSLNKQKRINKKTATLFTPFSYIHLDENMASKILADMLDPQGKHGQGVLFLREFIKILKPNLTTYKLSSSEISVEERTHQIDASLKRLDIFIDNSSVAFGIENKFFAEDRENQLADYLEHLSKLEKQDYFLVYLTPYGREPNTWTLPEERKVQHIGKLHCISWKDVLAVLKKCSKHTPEKLQDFISSFCDSIQQKIGEIRMQSSTEKEIIENILSSKENIDAASRIYETYGNIVRKAVHGWGKRMQIELNEEVLKSCGIIVIDEKCNIENVCPFSIKYTTCDGIIVNVAAYMGKIQYDIEYGLFIDNWDNHKVIQQKSIISELHEHFNKKIGNASRTSDWIWKKTKSQSWKDPYMIAQLCNTDDLFLLQEFREMHDAMTIFLQHPPPAKPVTVLPPSAQ